MVCWVLPRPPPVSGMLCVPAAFSELSVSASDPLKLPEVGGVKLTGNRHTCPADSEPGDAEPALTNGQAPAAALFNVKLAVIAGLVPLAGTGKVNGELPMLATLTVCGLSLLVVPGAVKANTRLGGAARFSCNARLLYVSTIYKLPFPANAMPLGPL